jgi:hypothetical protein
MDQLYFYMFDVSELFQISLPSKPNINTVRTEEDRENVLFRTERKAIPLQAWTGPEGSSSLRLPDFKTIGTWKR